MATFESTPGPAAPSSQHERPRTAGDDLARAHRLTKLMHWIERARSLGERLNSEMAMSPDLRMLLSTCRVNDAEMDRGASDGLRELIMIVEGTIDDAFWEAEGGRHA